MGFIFLGMNKIFRWLICCLLVLPLASFANPSKDLVDQFQSMPDWGAFRSEKDLNGDAARRLIAIYEHMARNYNEDECRAAIVAYIAAEEQKGNRVPLSKIYVFNRYYFNIKPGQPIDYLEYSSGGWNFASGRKPGALGPLDFIDGKFRFHEILFIYTGPHYDPLKEFDFFNEKFGRRYPNPAQE